MGNAYIVGAVRTPGGKKDGKLKNWHPSDLGALVSVSYTHLTLPTIYSV